MKFKMHLYRRLVKIIKYTVTMNQKLQQEQILSKYITKEFSLLNTLMELNTKLFSQTLN